MNGSTHEVAQPMELWCESSLPIREDLVQMIQERSYLPKGPDTARFSGKITIRRLLNNEEECTQLCVMLMMGLSPKLIGKRMGMSPRSVVRAREAMAERGELAPVAKRIRTQLDQFVELGLERMIEGVLTGEIHAGQLPIAVLAAIDKKGQLDAGVVPGTELTVGEATEANIRAAWAALDRAKVRAADSQSIVPKSQVVDVQAANRPDGVTATDLATTPKGLPAPTDVLLTLPDREAVPAATQKGGGGLAMRRPPKTPLPFPRKILERKEPFSHPHDAQPQPPRALKRWTQKSPRPSGLTRTWTTPPRRCS